MEQVAVVTGANKGIGFAIVKGLCEKFPGKVYLTSRDITRGKEAVENLKSLGLNALFHQLDVSDQTSVDTFKEYITTTHGGIDILVNNAAIIFKPDASEPFGVQAEETIKVNYFSVLRVCDALFPILRPNAQVVHVSSAVGHLSRIPSADLRAKFGDASLTTPNLNKIVEQFVSDAKDGKHQEAGWGDTSYVPYTVSKVGVSALTRIQQRNFDKEQPQRNISVNSVHPGYVDTDMTSHKGPLSIEEGAVAPLYLALGGHGLKGEFVWCDKQVVDWFAKDTPTPY